MALIKYDYDRDRDRNKHIEFLKERSHLLSQEQSDTIREHFISKFIDTSCEHYKKYIKISKNEQYYTGYLWNALIEYNRMSNDKNLDFLFNFTGKEVYIMSDLHSKERLGNNEKLLPFFPVNRIIVAKLNYVLSSLAALSQDVYIFDDTFSWYLILTHEFDEIDPEIYYKAP